MQELKERAAEIVRRLRKAYPKARCALDARSPLQLVVAAILSAQTPSDFADQLEAIRSVSRSQNKALAEFQAAKAYEADAYRLIEEQRTGERTHDYNLIQSSKCWGFGGIRATK